MTGFVLLVSLVLGVAAGANIWLLLDYLDAGVLDAICRPIFGYS